MVAQLHPNDGNQPDFGIISQCYSSRSVLIVDPSQATLAQHLEHFEPCQLLGWFLTCWFHRDHILESLKPMLRVLTLVVVGRQPENDARRNVLFWEGVLRVTPRRSPCHP